ncbi:MAG: hypothetical protein ACRC6V_06580 [Bacteroidales bacterium]
MNRNELQRLKRRAAKADKKVFIEQDGNYIRNVCLEQGIECGFKIEGTNVNATKEHASKLANVRSAQRANDKAPKKKAVVVDIQVSKPAPKAVTHTKPKSKKMKVVKRRQGESNANYDARAKAARRIKGNKAHTCKAQQFTKHNITVSQGEKFATGVFGNGDSWQGLVSLWTTRAEVISTLHIQMRDGTFLEKLSASRELRRIRQRDRVVHPDRGAKATKEETAEYYTTKKIQYKSVLSNVDQVNRLYHNQAAVNGTMRIGHEKASKWSQYHSACMEEMAGRVTRPAYVISEQPLPVLSNKVNDYIMGMKSAGDTIWKAQAAMKADKFHYSGTIQTKKPQGMMNYYDGRKPAKSSYINSIQPPIKW